jgi:O-antigen/teichoic acid export membrane protein
VDATVTPGRDRVATLLLLIAFVVASALGYLWTIIAARFLPPAVYADFAPAASILYFAVVALGPLSLSVAYFEARSGGTNLTLRVEREVWRLGLVLCSGLALLTPIAARLLGLASPAPLLAAVASAWLFGVLSVRRGAVQGRLQFGMYACNVALEATLRVGLIAVATLAVPRAFPAIATYAVSTFAALFLLSGASSAGPEGDLASFHRYLGRVVGYTAIYAAFLNTDILFAKVFFARGDAAAYGAASFLSRAAAVLVAPFSVWAVPRFAAAAGRSDDQRRAALTMLAQYAAMATLGVLALRIMRGPLTNLLLGSRYPAASELLVPMSIAVALHGFSFLLVQLPAARNDFRFLRWYAAGYGLEIIGLALVHVSALSVVGVVITAQLLTIGLLALWLAKSGREPG